jgi:stage II sporulation protein D
VAGAGDGHGIGMSQYGALGFAEHGFTADQILAHYYVGTTIGHVPASKHVTVLLRDGPATFSGASSANGHRLSPSATYTVTVAGANLAVASAGHPALTVTPPLVVSGPGPLTLVGLGRYRGSFVMRPSSGGRILTVNEVGLEDYVRGVIAAEMPSSWPAAALEAQAIAARTYVLTAAAPNTDFQVYDDTRSQMYGGVKAETPATDAAAAATTGQVVEYAGAPATTYFFASSGGYTEDIQNVWVGVNPEAWLQGVSDPYDDSGGNPFYRWKVQMSLAQAQRRLRGLVRGSFVGVRVLRHGVSPRVVTASVVGTGGTSQVTGVQLEQLLGLMSTYLKFTTITASGTTTSGSVSTPSGHPVTTVKPAPAPSAGTTTIGPPTTSSTKAPSSGGAGIRAATDVRRAARQRAVSGAAARSGVRGSAHHVSGSVFPGVAGQLVAVQRLGRHGFTTVARGRTSATGAYDIPVAEAGQYRVNVAGTVGPVVTVR